MRALLPMCLVFAPLTAGCMECSPMVLSVSGSTTLPVGFRGNETALRDAFVQLGFVMDEDVEWALQGTREKERVFVDATHGFNETVVNVIFDVPDRRFSDGEDVNQRAVQYSAEQIEAKRPVAQAIAAALAQRFGVPEPLVEMEEPGYDIC